MTLFLEMSTISTLSLEIFFFYFVCVCARVSVCEFMCAQVHVYVYTWKPEVDATVCLNLCLVLRKDLLHEPRTHEFS